MNFEEGTLGTNIDVLTNRLLEWVKFCNCNPGMPTGPEQRFWDALRPYFPEAPWCRKRGRYCGSEAALLIATHDQVQVFRGDIAPPLLSNRSFSERICLNNMII